jgi:predicted PurR-regulated permease PerM
MLVALGLGAVGWIVVTQLSTLAYELPRYKGNLKQKISDLQSASQGGILENIQDTVADLTREFEQHNKPSLEVPEPVTVVTPGVSLVSYVPSLVEFLGTAGLVFGLLLFMLIAHRDLYDRLLRIIGYGRLTITTKALDEAGQRISRYLLMQSLINGTYGCAVALGLFCLGVPYALLWGFLATLLRFIPYIGPALAILPPVVLSLAIFPGWGQSLLVAGLFVVLELIANLILEPLLYGRSAGVSEVGLMVAITFWTWLWGPIGLLLSTPLTVCLGVLGKYVPQLAFLGVLLSDEQVTELNRYYQRLVARDQDGAEEIVEELLETQALIDVYDTVLVPALYYAEQDQQRDNLTAEEAHRIYQITCDLVDNLGSAPAAPPADVPLETQDADPATALPERIRLVGGPAHDEADEVAFRMLQQVLDPSRFELHVLKAALLTAEVLAEVEQTAPAALCVGLVPPSGFAQTRYLCKRLRAAFPTLPIVVGCWGDSKSEEEHLTRLRLDGVEYGGTTLLETRAQIMRLPLLHTPLVLDAAPQTS